MIARAAIKGEFRIEQTMIRSRGNNPLKFSADDDDALAALLGVGRRSDMGPVEASDDALRDIRLHELAMVSAMQSAVRALLAEFEPVEAAPDRPSTAGWRCMAAQRKADAWDAFEAAARPHHPGADRTISTACSARHSRAPTSAPSPRSRRSPSCEPPYRTRHDLDQPSRLAGGHVPARAAFSAAGPLAGDAGARRAPRRLRPHPWGVTEMAIDRDLLGDRAFRADFGCRRVRGRHALRHPRRDRPSGAARPAGERPQRRRLSRRAGAPAGRGRGRRRQRQRRALRAARLRGLRHPFRLAAAGAAAGRHACGCAICSRPRSAPAITASAWPGSSRWRRTGGSGSTTTGSRRR